MMTSYKYFILCLIISFIWSCKSHKQAIDKNLSKVNCAFCDTLQPFTYSLKAIDKNIEGVPLIGKIDSTYRDSVRVLTKTEIQSIEEALFCFLGQKESVIDSFFPPEMQRQVWMNDNLAKKTKDYSFNRGDYVTVTSSTYRVEEKETDDTDLWLRGGGQFKLEFTKIGDEYIYSGTPLDTIQWKNCISIEYE